MLEVVGFAHVNADEGHELELREPLSRRGRQGQQISQVGNLRVDEISAELGGSLGRLCGIEAVRKKRFGR